MPTPADCPWPNGQHSQACDWRDHVTRHTAANAPAAKRATVYCSVCQDQTGQRGHEAADCPWRVVPS